MASLAYFSVYNISNLQQPMYRPLYWFGGHNDQPTIDYGLSVAEPPEYASDGKSVHDQAEAVEVVQRRGRQRRRRRVLDEHGEGGEG